MSDYIERQAVIDAVHEEFDGCTVWDASGERTADEFESIIDRVPSADVVSVVRCADCERSEYDVVFEQYWCNLKRIVRPDGYCNYGKRREE